MGKGGGAYEAATLRELLPFGFSAGEYMSEPENSGNLGNNRGNG